MFRDPLEGIVKDEPLVHFGVKGQKWGVRRSAKQLGRRVKSAGSKAKKGLTDKSVAAQQKGKAGARLTQHVAAKLFRDLLSAAEAKLWTLRPTAFNVREALRRMREAIRRLRSMA